MDLNVDEASFRSVQTVIDRAMHRASRNLWHRRIARLRRAMTGPRMMAALEAYLMRLPPCCM